jgi:hypothetical protein
LRKTNQPIIQSLNHGILFAGFPLASAASRPATETQGPTAQLQKLAAGREMNTSVRTLQAPILPIDKGRDYKEAHTRKSAGAIPLFLYEELRGKIMSAQGLETIEATVHEIVADRFIDPLRITAHMPSLWPIATGANA